MGNQKNIRFGVIGSGGAGRHRVMRLVKTTPCVEVVAAAEPAEANIKALEDALSVQVTRFTAPKGYRKMIDTMSLDAVGVFSPHTLHYEQAKYALEAGVNVLIEKPMVCGVGNALETSKLADKKGLVYLIHYQRHFEPRFIKGRELIQKGVIGEVKSFYVYMAQDWSGYSWRGDPKYSGGGQLNDSGSHYQDILLWMTDLLPKSVIGSADYYYRGQKKRVEMNGSFSVELSNGAAGRLIIVADYVHGFNDDVRILGEKGTLVFQGPNLYLHTKPGKPPKEIKLDKPKSYPECPSDNFGRLLTGKTKVNYVPAIFGARVALLTDAMLAAAKTGKRVECEKLVRKAGYTMKDLEIK
jgi:predicted dehydrogenase